LTGEGDLAKRPFEVGVSGVVGQIRTTVPMTTQVVANVWGLGTDLRWAVSDRFGVQGEVYVGQTLGTYMGGILQNINSTTFAGMLPVAGLSFIITSAPRNCTRTSAMDWTTRSTGTWGQGNQRGMRRISPT
jgi:hypothetical protein